MKTTIEALCVSLLFCSLISPIGGADDEAVPTAETTAPSGEMSGSSVLNEKLAALRTQISQSPEGPRRGRFQWVLEHLLRFAERGKKIEELMSLVEKSLAAAREGKDASDAVPWFEKGKRKGLRMLDNGNVGLAFWVAKDGICLESFFDLEAEREFLSGTPMPFWSLSLSGPNGKTKELNSAGGFSSLEIKQSFVGESGSSAERMLSIEWSGAGDGLGGLSVECLMVMVGSKVSCPFVVNNPSATWSLRNVTFPRLAMGQIGCSDEDDFFVVPHGSGALRRSPLKTNFEFSGRYPGGWCSMQFLSHYDADCGLYVGIHDPWASTKDFSVRTTDKSRMETWVSWPAPDSGVPGNDWECPGEVLLQTFRGDWFDASQIYKEWAANNAKWWPRGDGFARSDTPPWFEDIAVWAQTGGSSEEVVEPVKKFAEYMGVPTALHWYNWHVIPFDNDYPHYFPYKDGFPEGVKALQKAGVRVMPYINGRLWDTDLDDFKNNAIRFCTKDEKGQPYIEEYGSGAKLSPMCPTTELWQRTVQDLVLRLVGPEVGVDAVYVDQVAAATPALCFDRTHGHPLAGGDWWNTTGYWPMLSELQKKLSQLYPDKALTTECNAEPYVHLFDGYLTWHFQYQDQIPLFAAIYGGKIQLFSRAYQGESWKGLAMRMKTGQALVFGEQLGWINPGVVSDPGSAAFLRRMARLRYALRDYLAHGEMARPPTLKGDIPTVTADWQWGGKSLVTTPAVLSGAWWAQDRRLTLIFVNVSDAAQNVELDFDAKRYWTQEPPFITVTQRTESGAEEPVREQPKSARNVRLGPQEAVAFEISAGK
jgi:hypothetical protein